MNRDEGILITFEGIEGSGKTTQVRILEDHLKSHGHRFVSTREPGGTVIGDAIRKLLLNPHHREMQPLTELMLYVAQRAQHVQEFIVPALDQGKIVLCDRFCDATLAYQGGARKLPAELIAQLNEIATGSIRPRLTLLLDCPVEVGLARARERYRAKEGHAGGDRIEQEEIAFHERVRDTYLELAHREPNRLILIDGTADIDSIRQAVLQQVERVL